MAALTANENHDAHINEPISLSTFCSSSTSLGSSEHIERRPSSLEAQTTHAHPPFKQRLERLSASYLFGPSFIVFFGLIVWICNQTAAKKRSLDTLPLAIKAVPGYYGPGMYSGWAINGFAAVCQSKPHRRQEAKNDKKIRYIHTCRNISTLGVAIYACGAAGHELRLVASHQPFSPTRAAADRVCQTAWIFATLYLLHHAFNGGLHRIRRPTLQTATWVVVWIMAAAAKSADRIARQMLVVFTQKVIIPFLVGIPFPLFFVCLLGCKGVVSLDIYPGWQTAVLNLSTGIISLIYCVMPRKWRYDPDSPAPPLSAHTLGDLEQAVALATGLLVALPLLLTIWKTSRGWVKVAAEKAMELLSKL